jgi:hypothetical protein
MPNATKAQVRRAIRAINKVYEADVVSLIDWSAHSDGYAILVEHSNLDAIEVQYTHFPLPQGTFLEAINSGALRLVIA